MDFEGWAEDYFFVMEEESFPRVSSPVEALRMPLDQKLASGPPLTFRTKQ